MLELIASQYGPIAFGLVSTVILWKVIVAPELRRARADSAVLLKAVEIMRDTTQQLDSIVDRLNSGGHSPTLRIAKGGGE